MIKENPNPIYLAAPNQLRRAVVEDRVIDANEFVSLTAMIYYVAHKWGQNEMQVERQLLAYLEATNLRLLKLADYERAMRHLVDCLPNTSAA